MRKVASLLCALLCVGALVGCSGKPRNMSEEVYELGCKALDTVDAFLDADISASSAESTLDLINTQLEGFEHEDELYEINAMLISTHVSALSFNIPYRDRQTVVDTRNSLAEELNKSKR